MMRSVGVVGLLAGVLLLGPVAGGCGDVTNGVETDGGAIGDSIVPPLVDTLSGDPVSSCHPGGLTTFAPATYHSALAAGQGACVASGSTDAFAQYAQFYDACLGPNKTQVDCDSFNESSPTCASCLLTPSTAMAYGPLVNFGGLILPNVAGCLELTGLHPSIEAGVDSQALGCAKSLQALEECELAACKANCPVPTGGTLDLYDACAREADQGGCQSYASVASCGDAYRESDAAGAGDGGGTLTPGTCFLSFKDFYDAVAPLFCGPPMPSTQVSDAGAGTDAATGDGGNGAGDAAADASSMGPGPGDAARDSPADALPQPSDAPAAD